MTQPTLLAAPYFGPFWEARLHGLYLTEDGVKFAARSCARLYMPARANTQVVEPLVAGVRTSDHTPACFTV